METVLTQATCNVLIPSWNNSEGVSLHLECARLRGALQLLHKPLSNSRRKPLPTCFTLSIFARPSPQFHTMRCRHCTLGAAKIFPSPFNPSIEVHVYHR
jgi:hypothetical protein